MIQTDKRLSLSIPPSTSTSSTLANRRRKNKNLSLCISPDSTMNYLTSTSEPIKHRSLNTAFLFDNKKDNLNAYPNGPIKIMDNLYLGNEKNAFDLDYLKDQLQIQAILNVAAEVNHPYEYLFQSMDDLQYITPSPSLSKSSFHTTSTTSTLHTLSDNQHLSFAYQKLPWDHHEENLVSELFKAIDIIDKARLANQTILVHCQCGIARSATVIIAYVIKTLQLSTQDAYHYVKNISPVINPNLSLLFQLREFEQALHQQQESILSTSLSSALKRKLTKSTKSIFTKSSEHEPSWWKSRKLSLDKIIN